MASPKMIGARILLAAAALVACATPGAAEREPVKADERRTWPASAVARVVNAYDAEYVCTAVLVAHDTAVTARHCVLDGVAYDDPSFTARSLKEGDNFFTEVSLEFVDETGAAIMVPIWGMKLGNNTDYFDDWAVLSLRVDALDSWPPSNIEPIDIGFADNMVMQKGSKVLAYGFNEDLSMSRNLDCELETSPGDSPTGVEHSCGLRDGASGGPILMRCAAKDCVRIVGVHVSGLGDKGQMVPIQKFEDEIQPSAPPERQGLIRIESKSKYLYAKDGLSTGVGNSKNDASLWGLWVVPSETEKVLFFRHREYKTALRAAIKKPTSLIKSYEAEKNENGDLFTAWELVKADSNGNFCLRSVATQQYLLLKGTGKMTAKCNGPAYVRLISDAEVDVTDDLFQEAPPSDPVELNTTQVMILDSPGDVSIRVEAKGRRTKIVTSEPRPGVVPSSELFDLIVHDAARISLLSVEHEVYLSVSKKGKLETTPGFEGESSMWYPRETDEPGKFCLQSVSNLEYLSVGGGGLTGECDDLNALTLKVVEVNLGPLVLGASPTPAPTFGVTAEDISPQPTPAPTPMPTSYSCTIPAGADEDLVCLHQDYCQCNTRDCSPDETTSVTCTSYDADMFQDLAGFRKLETLELSDLGIDESNTIPWTALSPTLQTLKLAENKLNALPSGISSRFTNLRYLDVDSNELYELPSDLYELSSLERIQAKGNYLKSLPASISTLTRLTHLDLRGNMISKLPDSLHKLVALQFLDLQDNRLSSVDDVAWDDLGALSLLNLRGNDATSLPRSFAGLTGLRWLSLSRNDLANLPSSFGDLSALTWLSLSANKLEDLPSSFTSLTALTSLELWGNAPLERLPTDFGDLAALTKLTLYKTNEKHASFGSLPDSFRKLANLRSLNMRTALDGTLPDPVKDLTALTYLNVCGCNLKSLPDSITQLTRLQELDVRDNTISSLPVDIGKLSNLLSFTLIYNNLKTVPESFAQLTALRTMTLSQNPLSSLPESFGQLTELTELRFWDNGDEFTHLPNSFTDLAKLRYLVISSNPAFDHYEVLPHLAGLRTLNVATNNLDVLPEPVKRLSSLTELIAHNNNLVAFPEELSDLSNLRIMDLEKNALTSLEGLAKLRGLASLNVDDQKDDSLTSVSKDAMHSTSLQELVMRKNRKLTSVDLGDLPKLAVLDASHSNSDNAGQLRVFAAHSKLSSLRKISLEYNALTSLQGAQYLVSLQDLMLNGNDLGAEVQELAKIPSLTSLKLRGNGISSVPQGLLGLTNLKTLDLLGNDITSFPDGAASLSDLRFISLSKNPISTLPSSFGDLPKLREIRLWVCPNLVSLPDSFWSLPLEYLVIESSPRFQVPDAITKLTALTRLNLGEMELETSALPPLEKFTDLVALELFGNPFTSIDAGVFEALTKLTYLKLKDNELRTLPDSFTLLSNLDELDFRPANNFCGKLPEWEFEIGNSDVEPGEKLGSDC